MARPWHAFSPMLVLALVGCGGAPYPKATESMRLLQMTKVDERPAVGKDEAMLVFMRSSHRFGMVSAAVFDISDEKTKFIGIVNDGTKVTYRAKPGAHTFMVIKVSALDASGQAGFSLRPVRSDDVAGSEFADAENSTHFVATPLRIQNWSGGFEAEGRLRRAQHWPRWTNRPAEERAARTLNSEDGRM